MKKIRLIDANALCRSVDRYKGSYPAANAVISVVSAAPTIEAEPVRHGQWIAVRNIYGETKYSCSRCGHYIRSGMDKNYCPNCGSKNKLR